MIIERWDSVPMHDFTLVLDRSPAEDEYDRLFEAGCDDGQSETCGDACLMHFMRDAKTFAEALVSALRDIETAGFTATDIRTDDLVDLETIASRVGRSTAELPELTRGTKGPGGFPAPVIEEEWALYSWRRVTEWFENSLGDGAAIARFDRRMVAAGSRRTVGRRVAGGVRPEVGERAVFTGFSRLGRQ